MQVKDGAAWAALEYSKWLQEEGHNGEPVTIVPTAIVYTDKSKYRSRVSICLTFCYC
jgi:glycerol-3-phosphate O-acyltransferase / dihydroxyacetone phosphate acyltransferase